MTQNELQKLVERISLESFGKPFKHMAFFNPRLRTTGGRYLLIPHIIEFNPKQLELFGYDDFIKIVKHELCHYHLHLEGRGYKHGDQDFKHLLSVTGGSRHCQMIPGTRNQSRIKYCYQCTNCGEVFKRKRRVDIKRYACGKCRGRLKAIPCD